MAAGFSACEMYEFQKDNPNYKGNLADLKKQCDDYTAATQKMLDDNNITAISASDLNNLPGGSSISFSSDGKKVTDFVLGDDQPNTSKAGTTQTSSGSSGVQSVPSASSTSVPPPPPPAPPVVPDATPTPMEKQENTLTVTHNPAPNPSARIGPTLAGFNAFFDTSASKITNEIMAKQNDRNRLNNQKSVRENQIYFNDLRPTEVVYYNALTGFSVVRKSTGTTKFVK